MKLLNKKVVVIIGVEEGHVSEIKKLFSDNVADLSILNRQDFKIGDKTNETNLHFFTNVGKLLDLTKIDNEFFIIRNRESKFDILIINSYTNSSDVVADLIEKFYDQFIGVNLNNAYFCIQRALPFLNNGACIILTAPWVMRGHDSIKINLANTVAINSLANDVRNQLMDRNISIKVLSSNNFEHLLKNENLTEKDQSIFIKQYGVKPEDEDIGGTDLAMRYLSLINESSIHKE